ncbi:MAG: exodeoxyribonuclease VII small subunit [Prevotella sp.]|nr:exodeoxyribonuclease VII small subunit [Prevotella sp.]MDD7461042.1 exodeoxyribonuclease VII small subunit [Prevotellaceae bacterium]MDY3365430.1 exodeoxyribonuclease VII small subunit [Prevotella sp.]MDY3852198.1 exodeoxyribonuclease VII small subunit [Prevotella sp.]
MKKEIKYEEAVRQLEDIVSRMEEGDMDIDILGEELKKAQALIKICKDKLTKTDAEIKKLLAKG